jgi:DNA-binding transcriptional MerR regulator
MTNQFNPITAKELALEYNKPVSTIQRWARLKIIPCIQLGHRTRLYDREAVRRALLKKTIRETELV